MTEAVCSHCQRAPRAPRQRWCRGCRALWKREERARRRGEQTATSAHAALLTEGNNPAPENPSPGGAQTLTERLTAYLDTHPGDSPIRAAQVLGIPDRKSVV